MELAVERTHGRKSFYIEEWPYQRVMLDLAEFQSRWGQPGRLIVGKGLWNILVKAAGGSGYSACDVMIYLDRTNTLEPNEFIFCK